MVKKKTARKAPKLTLTGKDALAMRKQVGLTQGVFWARQGITQSGGSRYESGRSLPKPVQLLLLIGYGDKDQSNRALAQVCGLYE